MNPYLIAGVLASIVIAFTAGAWLGKGYAEGKQAKAQIEVIKQDEKKANQIEAKNETRKTEIRERIQIVEKQSPDWSAIVLPVTVADGLCKSVRCDP